MTPELEKKQRHYQQYLFCLHNNGDLFASLWRPFTFEEWVKNGMPRYDGGVHLKNGKEYLKTFVY